MKIRSLQKEEVNSVIPLCEAFCAEMGFPFNGESCKKTISSAIDNGNLIIAAIDNSRIIGLGGVIKTSSYTDYGALRAIEFIWHTNPALSPYKRAKAMNLLFNGMELWAKIREIPFSISVCNQASRDFLERRGYNLKEYHYCKEVV